MQYYTFIQDLNKNMHIKCNYYNKGEKMTLEELNLIKPEFKGLLCLNQKQTAEIIGVSSSTLENWRKESVGPEYKKIDNGKKGRVLYVKTSILEWLNNTIKTA